MSGHNKWSTIKHKKARQDSLRSKAWTKVVREMIVAARDGGGDIEFNPGLRLAVQKAKALNMPKDNIERAIKRGAGGGEGTNFDEVFYEGYGPGGVAVLVKALTDNKNRTVAEVRLAFSKAGGAVGEAGCVAWQFETKGLITIAGEGREEDEVMMAAIEAGAEDVEVDDNTFQITTAPTDLAEVAKNLEAAGYALDSVELTKIAQNTIKVEDAKVAGQTMKLWQVLEDNDDVQNVYTNADIDDALLAEIMG